MGYTDGKPSPTHKVSFYGVRCYFDNGTGALWGVNQLCDYLIYPVVALHNTFAFLVPGFGQDGFPFVILETYLEGR